MQDSDQQVKLHIVSQFVQYKENKILILLFSCTRFVMSHIFLVISAGFEPRNTIYHTSYPSHWAIKYGKLSNLQNWPLSNCLNWFGGKITNSTISDRFNLQNIQISDESRGGEGAIISCDWMLVLSECRLDWAIILWGLDISWYFAIS